MAISSAATILTMAVLVQISMGAVHKVGDSAGWTTIANIDYKKWAATKTFHLGDTIRFEYNAQFHNVMRVKHADYRSCNTSSPMASYVTGNDSITITSRGHHYFFCGVPGHCQAGQKLDINVARVATAPATTSMPPAPAVAVVPSPPTAKLPGTSSGASHGPYISFAALICNVFVAVLVMHWV